MGKRGTDDRKDIAADIEEGLGEHLAVGRLDALHQLQGGPKHGGCGLRHGQIKGCRGDCKKRCGWREATEVEEGEEESSEWVGAGRGDRGWQICRVRNAKCAL